MKTSNVFVCAILIAFIFGCSPKINYVKLHESKELKMPFNKKDFEDTDNEFYSIQSTKGTGAKSAIAKMNTLKAKADLTFKLKSHISSVINSEGQGSDNSNFSNRFKSATESSVNSFVERLKLVEEKWYVVGTSSSGKEEYELWQVYSLAVDNVTEVASINNE